MSTTKQRPSHVIKHEIKGGDGRTVRAIRIGALWQPDGNRPGRIHLDLIPTGWDGRAVFWPIEKDEEQE